MATPEIGAKAPMIFLPVVCILFPILLILFPTEDRFFPTELNLLPTDWLKLAIWLCAWLKLLVKSFISNVKVALTSPLAILYLPP